MPSPIAPSTNPLYRLLPKLSPATNEFPVPMIKPPVKPEVPPIAAPATNPVAEAVDAPVNPAANPPPAIAELTLY